MHVLFPGSFDPFTLGHLALVRRAAVLFGKVTVGVFHNADKSAGLLTPEERAHLVRLAVEDIPNVDVAISDGYVVDFCKENGISLLVRGIRGEADLPFEKMAEAYNRAHGVETIFLFAEESLADLSSSEVRRRIAAGETLADLIPAAALPFLRQKCEKK